ncbi:exocyst complex component 5 isoform X3 [Pieris rapae]|uniref:exocyst complex component 5 isoform X3 n=1 Tax=Pieris rapae TaxID=64459 RepID=UPI001E27B74C|nr:exocyst complex component 5 isoform X3 [Pieris rapae]
MMNQYLKELEADPFDPDEFVERMVRRSMQECRLKDDQFDPVMIHDIFTQAIQDLKVLQERQERKCARLEQGVQEEEKTYLAKLAEIMDQHTHCVSVFSALDERMSRCGGRALDVGEKLGAARAPRARAAAARDLLSHLANFLSPGPVLSDLFSDSNKLNEAADVIQKLYTIAQELPPDKFEVARKKIETKYDEIERNLIEDFVKAQHQGNLAKMKEIANIMTNFKGYSQCVDAFIETSQMNTLTGKDIFSSVLPLCKKNNSIINNVFPNPEQVMSKFVLNIFHLKLQKYIQTKLADKNDLEKYLRNLYDVYTSYKCQHAASLRRAGGGQAGVGRGPRGDGRAAAGGAGERGHGRRRRRLRRPRAPPAQGRAGRRASRLLRRQAARQEAAARRRIPGAASRPAGGARRARAHHHRPHRRLRGRNLPLPEASREHAGLRPDLLPQVSDSVFRCGAGHLRAVSPGSADPASAGGARGLRLGPGSALHSHRRGKDPTPSAMIAICDVKEYRSAVCGRGGTAAPAPAPALFDALHALCNLLLVKPENLHQVCEGETLAELDRSVLLNFIQLRADYKSHKLATFLKGLS